MKTLLKKFKTLFIIAIFLLGFANLSFGQTVIISEVTDPGNTANAKFIEIYNATNSTVNISGWQIRRYSNGNTSSTNATIPTTTNLASGDTWVIAYNSSTFTSAYGFAPDQTSSAISGNGDDVYELYNGSSVIDIYGEVGVDGTGEDWEYENSQAERNSSVCSGNGTWTSSEWTITSADTGDMSPGTHTCDCPGSSNDSDSEASDPTGLQIADGTISSINNDDITENLNVFKFDIDDTDNGDTEDTKVTNIRIKPAGTNSADWTDNIQGVKLNGSTLGAITIATTTITDTYIDLAITSSNLDVPNSTSETITMSIYLNTSNIEDGEILSFMIDADDHGFTADATGSTFADPFSDDVTSNDFTIIVDATQLLFVQQPTDTNKDAAMSPNPTVKAADDNGNVDIDYVTAISVSSDGTMTGDSGTWTDGVATFANLIHTVAETNLTLTASSGTLDDEDSENFDIIEVSACGLEEFDDGTTAPTGWTFTNIGGTYTSAGNFGNSSPSLKIDVTGDIIETAPVTNPSQLTFWIKGQGTDAASALLVEGWDGSWNTIENITNIPTVGTTKTYNSGLSSYTKFRFSYTKSAGNLSFDDVDVTCSNCSPPSAQATDIVFSNVTETSMDISWTRGTGGDAVIVLVKEDSAVDSDPSSGTVYTANSTFGSGEEIGTENYVVFNASATTVNLTGLSSATDYYVAVYEYKNVDVCYLIPGLTGNQETLCGEPTTNASTMTFSSITTTSMTVGWTNGDGNNRIVVAKKGSVPTWTPTDANTYTADASFGDGTELGTENYIVYNGNSNSVNVTNLEGGTTYYFKVFEYNCDPLSEDYLTNESTLNGNETTLLNNVQNLSSSCITNTTVTLNWDAPIGGYDGILVTVRQGDVPHQPTCADGDTYTSADTDYSAAPTYCTTVSKYVYNGTGNTITITVLSNATSYTFKVFTYQGSEWSTGTQITKTVDLLDVTNENATVGNAELYVSWTNPSNCYDEIMVVGKNTTDFGAIAASPSGDGTSYTANSVFGTGGSGANLPANEFCVYKSDASNVTVTGLTNSKDYCFKIFVRRGTDWSDGVTVCETPLDITIIEPADLMIIAVNTNYPAIGEEFTFVCFKDIKAGTPIDFTDNGWERDYAGKWGTTEGTIRLTRENTTLAAGTSVTVIMNGTNGQTDADFDIYVAGADDLAAGNWSISLLNPTNGNGFNMNPDDDIWIMQNGSWVENLTGTDPTYHDDDYTGNILYGWTATGWPGADPISDSKFSNLYPGTNCFNTDVSGIANNSKVKYTGAMTTATKLEWIVRVNDETNWDGYATDVAYDDAATPQYRQSGVTIPITAGGYVEGVWTGTQNTDWFDCGNWQSLTVPDETIDVVIGASATGDCVVDDDATEASEYGGIARCKDLTISNQDLIIEGDIDDKMEVHGNLTLNSGGIIDMDDGAKAIDGQIYLYGNWDNQAAAADFKHGEGTIHFVGDATQTITTNSFTEIFNNFICDNSSATAISLNNNIRIDGQLSHTDGEIDLNGSNIELRGIYSRSTGSFIGDASSNFTISNSGSIDNLYFITDVNLFDFTIDRTGENAYFMTDLYFNNDLTITDGRVTLSAGCDYDVDGNIVNTPGTASAFILKSDASGTASLIHTTSNVPATCERYLTADDWHYYFTPIDDANIDILTTVSWGGDNPNFFWYNEPIADYWTGGTLYNPSGWTAPDHNGKLLTTKAYIHLSTETYIYSLTGGGLFQGTKEFTLSYTDNGGTAIEPITGKQWLEFEGWNLFGNPYTSAFDWDNGSIDKTYIENVIYYYDNGTDQYKYYGGGTSFNQGITVNGGSQYIPANQGFFVKATSVIAHGEEFSIPNSARTHNSQNFWKDKVKDPIPNLIRLEIKEEEFTDEIVVRTLPIGTGVTTEHDGDFDAYKMFSWNNLRPQIYSRNETSSNYYAINSFPEFSSNKIVPLGVYIGETGEYTINMTENYFENTHVWLEDRILEINTNLLQNPIYTFSQSAEINNERFYLHFGINNSPILNTKIPDQKIPIIFPYQYYISSNMFIDKDYEDEIIITAKLANGDKLPEWLTFEDGQFYGNPPEEQELNIRVIATDIFGATAYDDFILSVYDNSTQIQNIEGNISIYPNPTSGEVNIIINNELQQNTILEIKNATGKIILTKELTTKNSVIDMSKFSVGIYFIVIKNDSYIYREKIILK